MRVKRRLAIFIGLALLLVGGRESVLAQNEAGVYQTNPGSPPPSPNFAAQGPNFNGPSAPPGTFNASMTAPEYSSYPSSIPVVPPPLPGNAYGSAVNPFPQISPYDYSFQNDQNVGGIWEHTERTRDRKYYFNADYLFMSTRAPQGIFGNPSVQSYVRQIRDFLDSSSGSGSGSSSSSGSGVSANATSQLLQDRGFVTDTPAYFASLANYYNALDLGSEGNLISQGARFTIGFWNPDNAGVDAAFWFGGRASDDNNAAGANTQTPRDMKGLEQIIRFLQNTNAPITTPDEIARYDTALNTNKFSPTQILEQNLLNLHGLPVADGTARGQTIPYDIYFDVKTRSQQIGTNLDYYFTPVYERKWITVSPSVGVTYMNIKESLSFVGIDSGMLYSPESSSSSNGVLVPNRDWKEQSFPNGIDDNQDGIIDNAGIAEPGPSSVSSSSGSGTSSGGTTLYTFPTPFALLPATLNIDTSTNLVGPTGGLRYLIGGKSFHLIGETKFGLMANFEQINLTGNNIGSTTRINGNFVNYPTELVTAANPNPSVENQQDLIVPTTSNPNPNAFSSSQVHAHVSPMFVQSITAEAPILQYVPVVKKIWPLNAAVFRAGYTFIWVGNVIDTNMSVNYQGDPMQGLFPDIQPSHSNWWTQNGSLGVSWDW